MNCGTCSTQNPPEARFCMSCGAALARACATCGVEVPTGARFCIGCGSPVAEPSPARAYSQARSPTEVLAAIPTQALDQLPEERRKATVVFADISGYTAISERMDPEAVKSFVERALRRLAAEVIRHGGTVDKYIGDNVMGVFGAPISHEDDPERAVRAALAMQEAMAEINETLASSPRTVDIALALRVGVNSGEVLAGRIGDEYTVIGDPVNVAARLEAAAKPGTVIVGPVTHRLTRNAIEYRELEPLVLKGKSEPVRAWEAIGILRSRAAVSTGSRSASTPLIGREDEIGALIGAYERVSKEHRPHLLTVIGQAGVGKSRLLREFLDRVAGRPEGPAFRLGRCPAYGSEIAYWALGEVLRAQFEIVDTDDPQTAWDKLRGGIERLLGDEDGDDPPERIAALIARPLGIEALNVDSPADEDPQTMRDRLFSAVRSVLEAVSSQRPLVLAVEDIHWADEGMLDLIEYLIRWVHGPVLLVCMARDELLDRRRDWGGQRRNTTNLNLDPLGAEEALELVGALYGAGNGERPNGQAGLIGELASRSGGNPLFAEEMVNRMIEEDSVDASILPDTVHAVLAARLDALRPIERHLMQHAAVVGELFWEGAITHVADEGGEAVTELLASLQDKDLLVDSPNSRLAGEREFTFKHGLIRDVAYSTLPKAVRARKHVEVGRFIEDRARDRLEGFVGLIADHYGRAAVLSEESDLPPNEAQVIGERAIEALAAAGDSAAALYSNQEALTQYSRALDLKRWLDPETKAEIAERSGDVAMRLGRADAAVAVWEECLEFHRGQENLERIGDLHRKIGAALWQKGDRDGSIQHYQRGIDLLKDGPPHIELVRLYEEAATLYMHTGDNMLAIYASEKALRLAERLGAAAAASRAHGIFGRVFGRMGDAAKARENLERSVELARGSDPAEAVRALLTLGNHLSVSEAAYLAAERAYTEALQLAIRQGDLPSQVELHAALAQIAAHRADWDAVGRSTEAAASLAKREGLDGKLCFPLLLRGILRWREGNWDPAEEALRRAHEVATQVGRSEIAFLSLFWLGATLHDRGDPVAADTAFAQALDICERAGLIVQSIEAIAVRAMALAVTGRADAALECAKEAHNLLQRLRYPVGEAATQAAWGITAPDACAGAQALAEARDAFGALGRPLDATRCELVRGRRLLEADPAEAAVALRTAAEAADELGVDHMAARARAVLAEVGTG